MLPERLKEPLRVHLEDVRRQHQRALADGFGRAMLPSALERKYRQAPLEAGCDIRTVQELLGHADVSTTMIYTHACFTCRVSGDPAIGSRASQPTHVAAVNAGGLGPASAC